MVGSVLTKGATADAIRGTLADAGVALTRVDATGRERQRFGEHALRVAGAQALARGGMDLYLMQLFARWGSAAVERYVQEAPLAHSATVAGRVTRTLALHAVSAAVADLRGQVAAQADLAAALQARLGLPAPVPAADVQRLAARVDLLERTAAARTAPGSPPPELVLNAAASADGVTYCGWAYGRRPRRVAHAERDASARCERCFPEARGGVPRGLGGSDDEDDDGPP